jgi:hypothetical protein
MIIGTYTPLCGTPSESNAMEKVDDLLCGLPDNDSNLINARNVRNAVYTLWERIDTATSSIIASASKYTNLNPSTINVGGIVKGSTFSDIELSEMWDMLLYPAVKPAIDFFDIDRIYEYGDTLYTFNFGVNIGSGLMSVEVSGPTYGVVLYNGVSTNITGTYVTNSIDTSFTLKVTDHNPGGTISSSLEIVEHSNAIYWGTSSNSSPIIGSGVPTWANGGGSGIGKEVRKDFKKSFDNINGNGGYIVFSWPSSYGTPSFMVNGNINTAFTKISPYTHTNIYGYVENYDVWVSNTVQNSEIAKFDII